MPFSVNFTDAFLLLKIHSFTKRNFSKRRLGANTERGFTLSKVPQFILIPQCLSLLYHFLFFLLASSEENTIRDLLFRRASCHAHATTLLDRFQATNRGSDFPLDAVCWGQAGAEHQTPGEASSENTFQILLHDPQTSKNVTNVKNRQTLGLPYILQRQANVLSSPYSAFQKELNILQKDLCAER